jgi:hypothetical protein
LWGQPFVNIEDLSAGIVEDSSAGMLEDLSAGVLADCYQEIPFYVDIFHELNLISNSFKSIEHLR